MADNTSAANDMTAAVAKSDEPSRDGSASSIATTPEPDAEPDAEPYTQELPQQQKRKGGRKPIYATSEERKQRNRQAQAAFRERRTEYIKQLESTIKHHEETLQTLQHNHRSAADECLMLRYKNSLLERILLEKGIDVQAELRAKTGSPHLGPTRMPSAGPAPSAPPPMQRAIMNRHHQARRSLAGLPHGLPTKAEGVHGSPLVQPEGAATNHSPHSQPTTASHQSSPSTAATKSPNFLPNISPNIGPISQSQQLRPQQPPPRSQYNPLPPQRPSVNTQYPAANGISSSSGPGSAMSGTTSAGPAAYYPSPFQSHMDQLEQEYDAQADMIDDQDPSDRSAPGGAYPQQFPSHMQPPGSAQLPPQQYQNQEQPYQSPAALQPSEVHANGTAYNNVAHSQFDPYDPMLDADPFGLSASMHFPTQFSYQTG